MRRIIIAGLAVLTTLAAVLAAVVGSGSGPVSAAVVATTKAAPAAPAAAASTSSLGLSQVSCVAADFCMGVGSRSAAFDAPRRPVAMIWTGARWRSTAVSLPKGWIAGSLADVSCASAAYCVADGEYFKSESARFPVAVTWNGRAWAAARRLPSLAGSGPFAAGISCPAARHCVVSVGANPTPKSGQAFIDVLAGTTWTVHALTPAKGSQASAENVSCASATHCVITGYVYGSLREAPLFALWNGKALSTMTAVQKNLPAEFDGISCPSTRSCVTVGTWFTGPADLGYYGIWNGSSWKGARILPQPKAMVVASPSAVSCPVATRCLAVGFDRVPGKNKTYPNQELAEFFNGRGWTRLSVPAPAGAADTGFNGVSCVSATSCVAVGSALYGTNQKTYRETALTGVWNGRRWRLVPAA